MVAPGRPTEIKDAKRIQIVVSGDVEKALKVISQREGKPISELLRPKVEEFAKAHADGNPAYPLDGWLDKPEMAALPTIYEDPNPEKVRILSKEDAKFMLGQMAKWYPEIQRKAKGKA